MRKVLRPAKTCARALLFTERRLIKINIVCVGIFTMKLVKYAHKHSSDQGLRMGSKMEKKNKKQHKTKPKHFLNVNIYELSKLI